MSDELHIPAPGEAAPAFRAETAQGGVFDLAEQRGKWVIVYFYPRANTPG